MKHAKERKEHLRREEEAWDRHVIAGNFECIACGTAPTYDDREIYLETQMCAWCAHLSLESG